MKLITLRSQILNVAKNWKQQYIDWTTDDSKANIFKQLELIDLKQATPANIANIIGNTSWACPQRCYECDCYFDTVIELGEEPDYESATTIICEGCLKKALELLE